MIDPRAFGLAAVLVCAVPASGVAADCRDLIPPPKTASFERRLVTTDDLVRMREFGPSANAGLRDMAFTISPDLTRLAFQMRRAEPDANTYCIGIFVLNLQTGEIRTVDSGGDLITMVFDSDSGTTNAASGIAESILPEWSPDGQWLLYLRRDLGVTQAWRAKADGTFAEKLTSLPYDVRAVQWSADGRRALVSTNSLSAYERALTQEGRDGYLYDDRFTPIAASYPLPAGPIARSILSVELDTKLSLPASPSDATTFSTVQASWPPADVVAVNSGGRKAWTYQIGTQRFSMPVGLKATASDGKEFVCDPEVCTDIVGVWWASERQVAFLKRETVRPQLGLYLWTPGIGRPRQVTTTEDMWLGCQELNGALICAAEGATQPRELVRINVETGKHTVLFDPNPEFRSIRLAHAERFHWTNDLGLETYGDLVLPPDYRPGETLPLITVGYYSRGFLRGGVGDEYPIQLFAAHGFAVLSFNRPQDVGIVKGGKTGVEVDRIDRDNWADFRSVKSSLDAGIDILVKRGIVDPARIGITGISNGVATGQYHLINSHRFAAAAFSSCCEDRVSNAMLLGPEYSRRMLATGYPGITSDGSKFWAPYAFSANAATMGTPLLLQMPDDEYLYALESYTALKEQAQPVEMYVFPDEHHVKWQPAHREAVYNRSLDWFAFWLKNERDPDPAKTAQYQRWDRLRVLQQAKSGTPPG